MPINLPTSKDKNQNLNIQGDLLFSPERSGDFLLEASPWFPTYPGLSPSYSGYGQGRSINQPYITTQHRRLTINGSSGAYVDAVNIDFGKHTEEIGSDLFRNNHSAKVALTIIREGQSPNILPYSYVFNVVVNRPSSTTFQPERYNIVASSTALNNGASSPSFSFQDSYDAGNQIYRLRVRSSSGPGNLTGMAIKAIIYVNT